MASSGGYPQLPTTVWRGVWAALNKAPSRKLDERVLAIDLGVQETAARQYLKEFQKLGLIDKDGQPSDLADRWRQNANESSVIEAILAKAYPETLRQVAPLDDLDREKITRWFLGEKLGIGAARNKAATYIMLAQGVPENGVKIGAKSAVSAQRQKKAAVSPSIPAQGPVRDKTRQTNEGRPARSPQLAVNVQIHIAADSTADQIDAIFSAMRRYFDESEAD